MAIQGRSVVIYRNGTAIAGTRVNNVNTKADLIKRSSPNTAEWDEYVVGMKNWTMRTGYLLAAQGDLADALRVGNTVSLVFGPTGQTVSTKKGLVGSAIVKEISIDSNIGNLAVGTFVFQGTGELAYRT